MELANLPSQTREFLLQDAILRDRATARRACLVKLLYQERFLTREQLRIRIEGELGLGCFGESAWKDTFFRDIRVVKQALQASGYRLAYSRNPQKSGYYLYDQPSLDSQVAEAIIGSIAEVDPAQISILRQLSPAERFSRGCSISDVAQQVVAYRIRQRNPALSLAEAERLSREQMDVS